MPDESKQKKVSPLLNITFSTVRISQKDGTYKYTEDIAKELYNSLARTYNEYVVFKSDQKPPPDLEFVVDAKTIRTGAIFVKNNRFNMRYRARIASCSNLVRSAFGVYNFYQEYDPNTIL